MKKEIIVNIEIPMGSNIKYEYDRKKRKIVVDRILRAGFVYPANYGYVAEALDWDGDELDVLVYSGETFMPGVSLNARIIGAMKMIDDGETDTKLIVVHSDDYKLNDINSIHDLPNRWIKTVETFFTTYKNWKRQGITSVSGFEDIDYGVREYNDCLELMNTYGSLSKNEFISQMKELHPKKYRYN
ncbi:inorganic diphosphatase [Candidatus Mycoplasma mahonii]|uniref:inorganic diphosphatase n=1 Tax=Candidatus Mycoplasma mahonii TaxID=3004105 RepID=UPI0026E958CA|nr:inorganic diphosphatase [Candidatus Mycoplasma mahonii]WKX02547.1 inorganic diphosphatase [Candidatus Mycoplasma mahonii]